MYGYLGGVILLLSVIGCGTAARAQSTGSSNSRTIPGVKPTEAQPTSNHPVKGPDGADQAFLKQAAIGNAFEIQMGQLAQSKASDPKVKQFGSRMVADHSKNDDMLKGVAQQQRVALPTELDPKHQSAKDALSSKSGAQFDKDYMQTMVADHTKTVGKFQHEASTTQDPTIKNYAQQSLPVLKSHLSEAQQVQSEVAKQ